MHLLLQFDRNMKMALKERIITDMFNEISGLTGEPSVPVGTTL